MGRSRLSTRVDDLDARGAATIDERLGYFGQLALILGAVSLTVGFLLVTTLVTVSVNERIGEIAVMRAVGVRRTRIVTQIVLESLGLTLTGTVLGAWPRAGDGTLSQRHPLGFPGSAKRIPLLSLPARGGVAGAGPSRDRGRARGHIPAWRASALPIAATLRREAIA